MALEILEPIYPVVEPEPFAGPDHPIRKVTRKAAFDDSWDSDKAARMASLFDDLAPEWEERKRLDRQDALVDALDRGGPFSPEPRVVELGAGTGFGTRALAERFSKLAVLDISAGMLAHGRPELAPQIRADAASLPFPPASIDILVLANMLLFPKEVDGALAEGGSIVWINSLSDQTPIHLSADDVLAALPGEWHARTSRAHTGTWVVARRAIDQP